eukprot:2403846-Pleurochrysis_carterae.AAC.5
MNQSMQRPFISDCSMGKLSLGPLEPAARSALGARHRRRSRRRLCTRRRNSTCHSGRQVAVLPRQLLSVLSAARPWFRHNSPPFPGANLRACRITYVSDTP